MITYEIGIRMIRNLCEDRSHMTGTHHETKVPEDLLRIIENICDRSIRDSEKNR